ncbi:hypothetical protein YC2023_037246 [Brassica napus]
MERIYPQLLESCFENRSNKSCNSLLEDHNILEKILILMAPIFAAFLITLPSLGGRRQKKFFQRKGNYKNSNKNERAIKIKTSRLRSSRKIVVEAKEKQSQGRDGYPEHSNDNQPTATLPTTSCKKHVNDDNATFLANLKDRFTEFVNTRMDEHKTRLVSKTPWTSLVPALSALFVLYIRDVGSMVRTCFWTMVKCPLMHIEEKSKKHFGNLFLDHG